MSIVLGIDIGTQSVKALFYDGEKQAVIAVATASLKLMSEADGSREQLAEWWISALAACLSEIDPSIKRSVKCISVSGQQHGFVPLAKDGTVLAPVKLWCDTSTLKECEQIIANFGGSERCIAEVGNDILPGYTASKIRWLKNNKPEIYQRMTTVLLPHDYINFYLSGERAMEPGDASGTGLFDIRKREWHLGMLAAVDEERNLLSCLPQIREPCSVIGILRSEIASELGLTSGIPIASGGGDNMMAAIATANVVPGRLTASLGTSGTLFAYSEQPIIDDSSSLAAFCSSTGGWLPLLCTMNGTVATDLTSRMLKEPVTSIDELVSTVAPGSQGVVTVPFFNGERVPDMPAGKGCIFGLTGDNYTPANLLRSAMESVVYSLKNGLDRFSLHGCRFDDIRLTGGGAKSKIWPQIIADVFGLPVYSRPNSEGAALGAAMQALWCIQQDGQRNTPFSDFIDAHIQIDLYDCYEPQLESAEQYKQEFQRYQQYLGAAGQLYN